MQPDLFSLPQASAPRHSLFLALFPDRETTQGIAAMAGELQRKHALSARLRPLDHLHITLHFFDDYPEIPTSFVELVKQVCAPVAASVSPFEVMLDQVTSFQAKPGHHPLILTPDETSRESLNRLHEALLKVLKTSTSKPFSPHLTLSYEQKVLRPEPVKPICWTAHEMALISSEQGRSLYHRLATWKLGA